MSEKNGMKRSMTMDKDTRKSVVQRLNNMAEEAIAGQESPTPEEPQPPEQTTSQRKFGRKRWIHTTTADLFFGGWIILNALVLAIETDGRTDDNDDHIVWFISDSLFNAVFVVELCMRLEAERFRWICSLWNIFDALLVAVSVWDTWAMRIFGMKGDLRFATLLRLFRLLRLVRILRVLRLVRFLKELMLLVSGIKSAMKSMVWGLLLLGITIFITALLLTKLVGKSCCDPDDTFQNEMYSEYFGNIVRSSFTLFQFTMEFQPDICRDSWEDGVWLTIFLIIYVGFTNITLLNTVASVIVDNIMTISNENDQLKEQEKAEQRESEIALQVNNFFAVSDKDQDRTLRLSDLNTDEQMAEIYDLFGLQKSQAETLFHILDGDKSGTVSRSEFKERLLRVDMEVEMLDLLKVEHQVVEINRTFTDMKAEFDTQQTQIFDLLSKIESRSQDLQSRKRRGPGPKAEPSQTWSDLRKPGPAADVDDEIAMLKESRLAEQDTFLDENLDSVAFEDRDKTAELQQNLVVRPETVIGVNGETSRPQSRLDLHDVSPELCTRSPDAEVATEAVRTSRFRDATTQTLRDATTQTSIELPLLSCLTPSHSDIQAQHSDDGENFIV